MCSYVVYWDINQYKLFDTEQAARDFIARENIKKYKIVYTDFLYGENKVIETW